MSKQKIVLGTIALKGTDGDKNRQANTKTNANFDELYLFLGASGEDHEELPPVLPITSGGTGAGTAAIARTNLDVFSKGETTQSIQDSIVNNLTTGGIDKSLSAEMGKNLQTNKLDKTANAVSASKLNTARTFTWTGDVTGSVSFDGSANVTNAFTLANTAVVAGAYGSNIKTVTLTVDAKGRLTAATQQDIRAATTAVSGVVQLNDTLNSTSIVLAATANAVKKVNDAVLATDIIAKAAIPASQKGIANGVATLDPSGVIPANQLPSYVDDVLEFATLSAFPATGETGKIYISIETSMTYRWTGTVYAAIGGGAGVSDTALRLFSPRTIALSGGVTGTATQFDGSTNISIDVTEIDAAKITKGTIPAARIPTLNQSTTGNAATATKLATIRKINGINFDGTQDITITAALKDGEIIPVTAGGTGATTAPDARTNLNVYSKDEVDARPSGLPIGHIYWIPIDRAYIQDGDLALDGQLLSRATYPQLWAKVNSGVCGRVVTDAQWLLSSGLNRACYSSGDGSTTFRLPDLNGIQTNSIKSPVLRGDGYATSGSVLSDAIRNITGSATVFTAFWSADNKATGAFTLEDGGGSGESSAFNGTCPKYVFNASNVVPTANENRPNSAFGVWLIKVIGTTEAPPSSGTYPTLTGGNTWNGTQAIIGNLSVSGTFTADIKPLLNAFGSAPIYASRAWVNFNGTGTVEILGSGNVSSITDNGVGDFTINYTIPMPHVNYGVDFGNVEYSDGTPISTSIRMSGTTPLTKTVSAIRISTRSPYNAYFVDTANISMKVTC